MKRFIFSFLVTLLYTGSALAANKPIPIPDWIKPGVIVTLVPATGSGSITIAVTADRRLVFCGAEPDANNHTPVAGQCNVPISKPGLSFPVEEFMQGQSGFSTNFKIALRAIAGATVLIAPAASSIVTGPASYGIAGAQGVGSIWNPSPIQTIRDSAELANGIKRIMLYGSEKDCGVPSILVANSYENLKGNLESRINKIAAKLIKESQKYDVPSEGLTFAMAGHEFISKTVADPNRPQTEEDQVRAMMDEIGDLRMKNIVQPALAKGECKYQPVALRTQAVAVAGVSAAVNTDPSKGLPATPATVIATEAVPAHFSGPAN